MLVSGSSQEVCGSQRAAWHSALVSTALSVPVCILTLVRKMISTHRATLAHRVFCSGQESPATLSSCFVRP